MRDVACHLFQIEGFEAGNSVLPLDNSLRTPILIVKARARLFTNLEPCLMCMGAAMSFFLGEIVYGLEAPGDGAVELVRGWVRREEDIPGYQIPKIGGGLLREESIRLFEAYVARREPGPMRDWAETLTRLR